MIDDLACTVTGGTLRAGDDADEARWVDAGELATLPVTDGLLTRSPDGAHFRAGPSAG